jgi:hypothetical protein
MPIPTYGAILGTFIGTPHSVPGNTTEYTSPFRADHFSGTEMDVRWRANRAGTLRNLMIEAVGTQPIDGDLVIILRTNLQTDTDIVVTIPAGTSSVTGVVFNETEEEVQISTGEDVTYKVINESADPSIGIRVIYNGFDQPIPAP